MPGRRPLCRLAAPTTRDRKLVPYAASGKVEPDVRTREPARAEAAVHPSRGGSVRRGSPASPIAGVGHAAGPVGEQAAPVVAAGGGVPSPPEPRALSQRAALAATARHAGLHS